MFRYTYLRNKKLNISIFFPNKPQSYSEPLKLHTTFQSPHVLTKRLDLKLSVMIYLLTFHLFYDIEKYEKSNMRIILLSQRQYFLFALALGIIQHYRCDRKKQTIILIK